MTDQRSRAFVEGQAKFSRISSGNVLLHFHVSDHSDRTRLHAQLDGSPTIRVIITSSNSTSGLSADALRASAFEFLPKYIGEHLVSEQMGEADAPVHHDELRPEPLIGKTLDDIEKLVVRETIARNAGSIPKAARMLGVSPSTLYRKLGSWQKK